jgi:hypothetical protein
MEIRVERKTFRDCERKIVAEIFGLKKSLGFAWEVISEEV